MSHSQVVHLGANGAPLAGDRYQCHCHVAGVRLSTACLEPLLDALKADVLALPAWTS